MKSCVYCGAVIADERPYDHCTAKACVREWKRARLSDYSLVAMPKQGYQILPKEQVIEAPTRSSGR